MKKLTIVFVVATFMIAGVNAAHASHINGYVYCDVNQNGIVDSEDEPFAGVIVNVQDGMVYPDASETTDANGYYAFALPPDWYTVSLDFGTLPSDAVLIDPTTNGVVLANAVNLNWLIDSATCREQVGACWLTAGGVKFDPVTGLNVAQHENSNGHGPKDSVGGVVFPSCSPDPGVGGNWNHIFHKAQWHLKGTDLTVLECGNVEGIEPGTESPVCPYNYIEFVGTGTLVGIGGNKEEYPVKLFVRAEDRNEPGNEHSNPNGGADIDRYLLRVFDADTDFLLLEVSDASGDPITITGGNFQIHCSSCDN